MIEVRPQPLGGASRGREWAAALPLRVDKLRFSGGRQGSGYVLATCGHDASGTCSARAGSFRLLSCLNRWTTTFPATRPVASSATTRHKPRGGSSYEKGGHRHCQFVCSVPGHNGHGRAVGPAGLVRAARTGPCQSRPGGGRRTGRGCAERKATARDQGRHRCRRLRPGPCRLGEHSRGWRAVQLLGGSRRRRARLRVQPVRCRLAAGSRATGTGGHRSRRSRRVNRRLRLHGCCGRARLRLERWACVRLHQERYGVAPGGRASGLGHRGP